MLHCYHKVCIYVGSCVCVWILSTFWDLVPLFPSSTISYLKIYLSLMPLFCSIWTLPPVIFPEQRLLPWKGLWSVSRVLGVPSSQKSLNFLSAPAITYKLESIHIIFTFVILHSSFHLDYFPCAQRTSIKGGLLVANSIFNEKYV